MDQNYEEKYHKLEEKNWWFVMRREFITKLLSKDGKSSNILEIGCSGGLLHSMLIKNGFKTLTSIDISDKAINLCKERGLTNTFIMDGANTIFDDHKFDIIIASDVLEHIDDDKSAINEWRRILKQNGKLIIFVPAFKSIWSKHDVLNHHYRRYEKKELQNLIQNGELIIEKISFWNFTLFFPVYIKRRIFRKFRKNQKNDENENKDDSDLYAIPSFLNFILLKLLKIENWYLNRFKFPVGLSLFVICKVR